MNRFRMALSLGILVFLAAAARAADPSYRVARTPAAGGEARFGPPPPATLENPRSRRQIVAGSFEILVAAPAVT